MISRYTLAIALIATGSIPTPGAYAGSATPVADRRIRTLLYDPAQVVRLRAWVGYHVDLEFEPGETFMTLGSGDLDGLSYGAYANHLVIKPKAPSVHTNLTVITSRRTYIFDYSVADGVPDARSDDLVYSLRFSYPTTLGASTAEQVKQELEHAVNERPRNYDYWFCGDESLQPVEASDDGVHTRLRFSPSAEIPAFFVRNDDGVESLLNYNIDLAQGDVVIHRTARRLILRRGKLVGCIVNKGYSGSGERLDSGTISPQVKRTSPEAQP